MFGISGFVNYGMMNGMSMMGGMNGVNSGNMHQYFKMKYGCEDCFRTQPYMQEYPKPIMPVAKQATKQPSLIQRILNKIMG